MKLKRILKIWMFFCVLTPFFAPNFLQAFTQFSPAEQVAFSIQDGINETGDQIIKQIKDAYQFNKAAFTELQDQFKFLYKKSKKDIVKPYVSVVYSYKELGSKVSDIWISVAKQNMQTAASVDAVTTGGVNNILKSTFDYVVDKGADALLPLFYDPNDYILNIPSPNPANKNSKSDVATGVNNDAPRQNYSSPTSYTAPKPSISNNSVMGLIQNLISRVSILENLSKTPLSQVINNYYTNTYSDNAVNAIADSVGRIGVSSNDSLRTELLSNANLLNTNIFDYVTTTSTTSTSTFAGPVSASVFYGDGSQLTGISGGSSFSTSTTRGVFSSSATGLSYDNSTGIFSLTSGYNIPLTASTTEWSNKVSSQWTTLSSNIYYNSGSVGIGTTTPASKLNIYDNTSDIRIGQVSTDFGGVSFNGELSTTKYNIGSGLTDNSLYLNRPTGNGIYFKENNGTSQLTILPGGNVGIGTDTSTEKLQVNGVLRVQGPADDKAIIALGDSGSGSGNYYMGIHRGTLGSVSTGGNYLNLGSWGGIALLTGNAAIGSQTPRLVIEDGTGYVGIGTTTPSVALSVVGAGNFTGDVTANSYYGDGSHLTGITSFSTSTTRGVFSSSATGLSYDNSTGIFSLTSGYNIPLTASTTEWSNKVSSQWTTLSSNIYYNSGSVGIGTTTPSAKLAITGTAGTGDIFRIASSTDTSLLSVDYTGALTLGAGSAASPVIKLGGSTNTGIFQAGSGMVSFSSAGAELFRISTGSIVYNFASTFIMGNGTKIGFNTTPDIYLSRNSASALEINNGSTGTWRDLIVRNMSMGTTSTSTTLIVQGSAGKDIVDFASSTGASMFRFTSTGRLGIGTSNPSNLLEVSGGYASIGGVSIGGNNIAFGAISSAMYWPSATIIETSADGLLKLSNYARTDFGRLQLGGTTASFPAIKRNGAGIDIRLADDSGYSFITGSYFVATSSTATSTFAGLVGIGTTTPSAKLAITGTAGTGDIFNVASSTQSSLFKISSTGALYVGGSAGTSGYVLQSIGISGSPQWVATSTLGISGGGGSSQWTTSGSDIYYTTGNVSIGTTTSTATLSLYNATGTANISFSSASSTLFTMGTDGSDNSNFKISTPSFGDSDVFVITSNVISTSYSNAGGTGNRTGVITVTDSGSIINTNNPNHLINGSNGNSTWFVLGAISSSNWIKFDFGAGHTKVIQEATYTQQNTATQGVWQWQGSNDDSSWTNIGSSFTLGGATTDIITELASNTVGYRYYRMLGVSGSTNAGPLIYQMDFKITESTGGLPYVGINDIDPGAALDVTGWGSGTSLTFRTQNSVGSSTFAILDNGKIGVGTTTPDQSLVVVGSIRSTSLLGGATNLTTDASGNIIRDPSDERLKENIVAIDSGDALSKVLALRGVTFEWKDKTRFGSQNEVGFIAQEVQGVIPEAVSSGGDYLSLSVRPIVAILVEAVKDVVKKITALADRVQTKELCVGDTCVTETQLKALLQNSGVQPAVPSAPSGTSTPATSSSSTIINQVIISGQEYSATEGNTVTVTTDEVNSSALNVIVDTDISTGTSTSSDMPADLATTSIPTIPTIPALSELTTISEPVSVTDIIDVI